MVEVEQLFIGAGCNRIVNNISWGPSGLVSFGAQNAVAIFCPETAEICTTLPGHKAVVNCTQWIPSVKDVFRVQDAELYYLLSGGADGSIILWELQAKKQKWRQVLQVSESHKKGVTCITEIMISQKIAMFASTSSDCTVRVWEIILPDTAGGDCSVSCLESLYVGPKPMVALSLAELPGSSGHFALAMGGLDHKLHLYCGERMGKFTLACELKAHTDWIRSLDFSFPISDDKTSIFLVSSSQDKSIRIWKMALHSTITFEAPPKTEDIGLTSYIEGPIFSAGSFKYQVSLESLLIGHEDWVYSVRWHPPLPATSTPGIDYYQPLSIVSASMDKTMMIWRPEKTTGIWVNMVSVGEISHCALGFYGGHWSLDGMSILAHGYGGSFHLWKNIGKDSENWQPQKVPSGHFSEVTDVSWAKYGEYVLSVSHDQTTRVFAPWSNVGVGETNNKLTWHEIARPQVHGHDISCMAIIQGEGNHRFVSGADEKVARVFEAPLSFLKTLAHTNFGKNDGLESIQEKVHVLGANMSALGLSQKPIYHNASGKASSRSGNDVSDSLETIPDAMPAVLTVPPVEDQLAWHTLWPETHKLYGHGNELYSLTCDHKGMIVASSCKAQSAAVAEIWLWEVGSWRAVGRLQSHSLTVTHMAFSFDDHFLLAVSRDRQFSVFFINATDNEVRHELLTRQEGHKRIIWACSWNPFCHDFATGSRDKSVKIWGVCGTSSVNHLLTLPQFGSSVTALSWLGCDPAENSGYLAVGMESGLIELWNLRGVINGPGASVMRNYTASPAVRLDTFLCHVSAVNRLTWRGFSINDSRTAQLASCGTDNCVRVFEFKF